MIKIGINGFGRIGRLTAREATRRGDMDIVAINAPDKTPEMLAYYFMYDTVHGKWEGTVGYDENHLIINGKPILLLNDRNPANLGWGKLGAEYVVDCTGAFLMICWKWWFPKPIPPSCSITKRGWCRRNYNPWAVSCGSAWIISGNGF